MPERQVEASRSIALERAVLCSGSVICVRQRCMQHGRRCKHNQSHKRATCPWTPKACKRMARKPLKRALQAIICVLLGSRYRSLQPKVSIVYKHGAPAIPVVPALRKFADSSLLSRLAAFRRMKNCTDVVQKPTPEAHRTCILLRKPDTGCLLRAVASIIGLRIAKLRLRKYP